MENLTRTIILAIALIAVPVTGLIVTEATSVLARQRPSRTTERLMKQVAAAKGSMAQTNNETLKIYLEQLRRIDASETPRPVAKAFSNYVSMTHSIIVAREMSRDTKSAYVDWVRAEQALDEVVKRIKSRSR